MNSEADRNSARLTSPLAAAAALTTVNVISVACPIPGDRQELAIVRP
jgi:hypothetical protein